jgi:hypothetical protein
LGYYHRLFNKLTLSSFTPICSMLCLKRRLLNYATKFSSRRRTLWRPSTPCWRQQDPFQTHKFHDICQIDEQLNAECIFSVLNGSIRRLE